MAVTTIDMSFLTEHQGGPNKRSLPSKYVRSWTWDINVNSVPASEDMPIDGELSRVPCNLPSAYILENEIGDYISLKKATSPGIYPDRDAIHLILPRASCRQWFNKPRASWLLRKGFRHLCGTVPSVRADTLSYSIDDDQWSFMQNSCGKVWDCWCWVQSGYPPTGLIDAEIDISTQSYRSEGVSLLRTPLYTIWATNSAS